MRRDWTPITASTASLWEQANVTGTVRVDRWYRHQIISTGDVTLAVMLTLGANRTAVTTAKYAATGNKEGPVTKCHNINSRF